MYPSMLKPGANVAHNLTLTLIFQLGSQVCCASNSRRSLKTLASGRAKWQVTTQRDVDE